MANPVPLVSYGSSTITILELVEPYIRTPTSLPSIYVYKSYIMSSSKFTITSRYSSYYKSIHFSSIIFYSNVI